MMSSPFLPFPPLSRGRVFPLAFPRLRENFSRSHVLRCFVFLVSDSSNGEKALVKRWCSEKPIYPRPLILMILHSSPHRQYQRSCVLFAQQKQRKK
ncbi:hypothetical protein TNCV_4330141 [Trichonephila clavipes]|nr:hypothetical protein TNCV_4330141 [Trichonephila clavipes]